MAAISVLAHWGDALNQTCKFRADQIHRLRWFEIKPNRRHEVREIAQEITPRSIDSPIFT